jgi:hypothetical protein
MPEATSAGRCCLQSTTAIDLKTPVCQLANCQSIPANQIQHHSGQNESLKVADGTKMHVAWVREAWRGQLALQQIRGSSAVHSRPISFHQ